MIVAGVMSGTSADGINVALVRLSSESAGYGPREGKAHLPHIKLIGHAEYAYPKRIRAAILAAMNASTANVGDLARLSFLLGELYADAVLATQARFGTKAQLVGCHGQTLYHQGEPRRFFGRSLAATWQTGEAAVVAARLGVPVVSDFRPADIAAGGKGAPLVPFFDYLLLRDEHAGRIAQNIGGIANLTAIPARAKISEVIAFDTGPGNMVIDAVTEKLFHKPFDQDGRIAARGSARENVIDSFLRREFFRRKPPKTAGREEFGHEFVRTFIRSCGPSRKEDIVATATALTARSIADAIERFVVKRAKPPHKRVYREMILSGGGTKNPTLVAMLEEKLALLGLRLRFSDEFGVPSEAKEAAAFAVLAHHTWRQRASNVPSATGAKRAVVLGKISYP